MAIGIWERKKALFISFSSAHHQHIAAITYYATSALTLTDGVSAKATRRKLRRQFNLKISLQFNNNFARVPTKSIKGSTYQSWC